MENLRLVCKDLDYKVWRDCRDFSRPDRFKPLTVGWIVWSNCNEYAKGKCVESIQIMDQILKESL